MVQTQVGVNGHAFPLRQSYTIAALFKNGKSPGEARCLPKGRLEDSAQ